MTSEIGIDVEGQTTRPQRSFGFVAAQQGLLQILRDFCEPSNVLCENCQFPELVRGYAKANLEAIR